MVLFLTNNTAFVFEQNAYRMTRNDKKQTEV